MRLAISFALAAVLVAAVACAPNRPASLQMGPRAIEHRRPDRKRMRGEIDNPQALMALQQEFDLFPRKAFLAHDDLWMSRVALLDRLEEEDEDRKIIGPKSDGDRIWHKRWRIDIRREEIQASLKCKNNAKVLLPAQKPFNNRRPIRSGGGKPYGFARERPQSLGKILPPEFADVFVM